MGGRIPVNPSGGLESRGHPLAATGLAQIYELMCSLESIQWTRGRPGVTPSAGISSDWKDVDVALLCTANVDTIDRKSVV